MMIKENTAYIGYKVIHDSDPLLPSFYAEKDKNWFDLLENQYLLVVDEHGISVDRYKWQDGKHKAIYKKPVESMAMDKVKPKNPEQAFALDMLLDPTITVKVMTGSFGSGKTMLACCAAFQMMQSTLYDKIVWVRNNIEVKDTNSIGALPGSYTEKMSVWAMPLADHLGGVEELNKQITFGKVEIEHLGFLRGRDIKNSIIICSEAEHLTREHVQLLLGRVAEGSVLIIEGDRKQIDRRAFEQDNGITAAISHLKGNRLFGYVHLRESVRSETAKLADLLDKTE
jgi:PhoH-like ATPase